MNSKKKKKSDEYWIFKQDTGIFKHEILITVGATTEQVLKSLIDAEDSIKELAEAHDEQFKELVDSKMAGYALCDRVSKHIILALGSYQDDWYYWETLAHELHHVVEYMSDFKLLDGELEAKAYLFEYLFRSIRRKLQGIDIM